MQPEPNQTAPVVTLPIQPADISEYARLLGRRGGAIKSEKKTLASRRNGKLGGRPKKPTNPPAND